MTDSSSFAAPDRSGLTDSSAEGLVPSSAHLDRALVKGLAWMGMARFGTQILTWAATIIIARLLTREDYGIWTGAGVYLGIVNLLSEFGIGASIVMLRDLSRKQIAQVNGLSVITGTIAMLVSLLLAGLIAQFYRTEAMGQVIRAMSIVFLISAFRVVPLALLQKELRFRQLALVDAGKTIVQTAAIVVCASAGLGYWTFPIGAIAAETAWTFLILALRRHPIAFPQFSEIGRALTYSADVLVSRLSWYAYSNADFVTAGRRLGEAANGLYGMAWNMSSVPVEKVNSVIMSVTPAFLSAVQDRKAELRRYLTTLTGAISIAAFPAGVGLALVADDFVRVALGSKWEGSIGAIRLLAIYSAVRAISPIITPVLNALGETRFAMWNNLLALALMPAAFILGSTWGTTGIAAAWLVAHPLILLLAYRRVASAIELEARVYLRALWPAFSCLLIMIAAVLAFRFIPIPAASLLRLFGTVAAGALAYGSALLIFHRGRVRALRQAIRLAGQRTS